MKLAYTPNALGALDKLPAPIRKAFYKQAAFLAGDLHHPSLHAKKYSEAEDKWQARVNRGWRSTSESWGIRMS
jgi:mRNA-degrading endonuclease RelE of RelBE toxin-antitoxin system